MMKDYRLDERAAGGRVGLRSTAAALFLWRDLCLDNQGILGGWSLEFVGSDVTCNNDV